MESVINKQSMLFGSIAECFLCFCFIYLCIHVHFLFHGLAQYKCEDSVYIIFDNYGITNVVEYCFMLKFT